MASDLKRSISIAGHRTSLSLEREFWERLQHLSRQQDRPVSALISEIDQHRGTRNLSSAIRVYLLGEAIG